MLSIRRPNMNLRGRRRHRKYRIAGRGKTADGSGFSRWRIRRWPGGDGGTVGRKFLNSPGAEVGHKDKAIRLRGNPRRPLVRGKGFLRSRPGFYQTSVTVEFLDARIRGIG